MGDIDFEEQLALEKLDQEKKEKEKQGPPGVKTDTDGTKYEWDPDKRAWFPKIDTDFLAQYQMNYGVPQQEGENEETNKEQQDYTNYYNYYQNYYQAAVQQEEVLSRAKKEKETDETHEETVEKLASLENKMQSGEDLPAINTEQEYQNDSTDVMKNYTEEQKKQYNDYWSYYYNTDYHDYYTDCMTQEQPETASTSQDNAEDKKKGKKRKAQQEKRDEGWFEVAEEHNCNVYVSGLPLDVTLEEFTEMMTKFGLVMYDPRSKKPKLKLYMDENGQPKGDGRCCFIKKESVDLALSILDGSELRGHTVKVERAQFTMKGNFDPTKKKKKLTNREKKKLKERQQKMFDWRPDKPRGARQRHEKVVILKNVFDPSEFEDDPVKINVLKDRIKSECTKYGEVKKVVVYDRHQDGVVMVHFSEADEADMCIEYMNQRYLAQRRLLASTWDGKVKFEVLETEAEREERLKKWVDFLEDGDNKTSTAASTAGNKDSGINSATQSSSKQGSDTDASSLVIAGNGVSMHKSAQGKKDTDTSNTGGSDSATSSSTTTATGSQPGKHALAAIHSKPGQETTDTDGDKSSISGEDCHTSSLASDQQPAIGERALSSNAEQTEMDVSHKVTETGQLEMDSKEAGS